MQLRNRIQGLVNLKGRDVQPSPWNFRTHGQEQRDTLRAAMESLGIIAAGIVRQLEDGTYQAIDGHLRSEDNQNEELPWLLVDLDEAEARQAILTLDPIGAMAGMDSKVLDSVLQKVDINDESLQNLCQKLADEAGLYKFDSTPVVDDEDSIPQTPTNPVSKLGDVWIIGDKLHRLGCGDSTDAAFVSKVLNGAKPFIMVTDPPYGVVYDPGWRNEAAEKGLIQYAARREGTVQNDDRIDWSEAYKLFPGDVAYVWHAGKYTMEVSKSLIDSSFEIRSQIIWAKPNFAISRGDYHWRHEPCAYSVRKGKKSKWCGDRSQSTVWEISNRLEATDKTDHGTQKPVECMARPIRNHGGPEDSVYEPFSGSGSCLVAAQEIGRTCYAIELHPPYVDVALTRLRNRFGFEPILESTGQTFTQVKEERLNQVASGESADSLG